MPGWVVVEGEVRRDRDVGRDVGALGMRRRQMWIRRGWRLAGREKLVLADGALSGSTSFLGFAERDDPRMCRPVTGATRTPGNSAFPIQPTPKALPGLRGWRPGLEAHVGAEQARHPFAVFAELDLGRPLQLVERHVEHLVLLAVGLLEPQQRDAAFRFPSDAVLQGNPAVACGGFAAGTGRQQRQRDDANEHPASTRGVGDAVLMGLLFQGLPGPDITAT